MPLNSNGNAIGAEAGEAGLTGSRIRERRQVAGLRQADLAREIGISATYLNLIEHNRRRIGGKLLLRIAEVLGVETAKLTEGAEAGLIVSLRDAEANADLAGVETDRIEEFAARFSGWARLLAHTHQRVRQLEQTVDGLSDLLSHDPALAASVHEVLSAAASIRSTASILVETEALEPEWLQRFHAIIDQDSARLASSSRALAHYLEEGRADQAPRLPREEVDHWLDARDYALPELEPGGAGPGALAARSGLSEAATALLLPILEMIAADAARLPLARLGALMQDAAAPDPVTLARRAGLPAGLVLRRLACLPDLGAGYVLCDRSGSLLLRKSVPGFVLPRFGAGCPLWPLFQALSQPGVVLRTELSQLGRRRAKFDCYAVSEAQEPSAYNQPPLVLSGMLLVPSATPGEAGVEVGSTCRFCPGTDCAGRREPSVLSEPA